MCLRYKIPNRNGSMNMMKRKQTWARQANPTPHLANHEQSFYVTVDVSSFLPQTRAPKKNVRPKVSQGADTANPSEQQQHGNQDEETLPIDPALDSVTPIPDESNTSAPADSEDRIQILDLHTPNPLISYNNRIYSCTWGSTLGTDIFLTSPTSPPATSSGETLTPLLSLPKVSVLGTSCVKLTGRPVTISPKTDNPQPTPTSAQTPIPPTNNDTSAQPPQLPTPSSPPLPSQPTKPYKIPLSATAPSSTRKQASFLESLMAIKTAKGESDQVTIHATKSYSGHGWRAQRRLREVAEAMDLDAESTYASADE
ncbi:MAG: hypothetical protein Q9170_005675, partial [Blastenia crenularia]